MALKTILETIRAARMAYLTQLDEGSKRVQAELGAQVAALMESLPPEYTHLTWTQYTPYFNDGDACTFSAHDPSLCKGGPAVDDPGYNNQHSWPTKGMYVSRWNSDDGDVAGIRPIYDQLHELWKLLTDDALESAFGDHVRVIIRRDGSHLIGSYDHD